MNTLAENMRAAWAAIGGAALATLEAAEKAPALFKQDAVDSAAQTYMTSLRESARWAA